VSWPSRSGQEGRAPAAGVVAAAGALDLDHLGAEVGQGLGAPGPGQHARQVEHAHAIQRARGARQLSLAGAPARTTLYACSTGGATWAVSFADVQDPARVAPALVALRQAAAGNVAAAAGKALDLRVAGATPHLEAGRSAFDGRYPDGRAVRMQSAVFSRGTVVYQATVLGERLDEAALDTFYTSLRFPT
jgi:hypothetical protein